MLRLFFSLLFDPVLWVAGFFVALGLWLRTQKQALWGWVCIGIGILVFFALVAQRLHWIE